MGLRTSLWRITSHELRTPLHGIVNIAESLLEGVAGETNPDQARQLSMIVSTGRRLNYLIHDILDFSTLGNGELVLNRQAVDLPATAQSVLEVIRHLADKKGIRLSQEWPDELPLLDADEDRLRQILFNLLGNAVKFTHQGEIGISAEVRDRAVKISVRDTGIGIAWDRLSAIFEPYNSMAAMDLQGGYSGTGIGLSITKKLIELNDGQIGVQSELGAGSLFYFTLPASSLAAASKAVPIEERADHLFQKAAQETAASAVHGNKASPFTVLIVDDDPVNLQVLINLLSIDDYSVIAVDNGADALEALSGMRRIDLVITDWMMPEMSGLELCRRIRDRFALSELPVLILTARNFEGDIGAGFSAGVNDFLTKPVDSAVLRVRVRTLLALRQSVQAAIRSEMAFLQAQIKPHFLYNAMNTIISICHTEPERAAELLMDLSFYLRSSFDFQNREQVVSLEKELELVQAYAAIEQARFGDRLRVIFDIDEPLKGFIPPLSIQPIVENAVRHGVMQKTAGGTIVLSVRKRGAKLIVSISDDGVGMKQREPSSFLQSHDQRKRTGVGLINIHRRLMSSYGAGLSISSKSEEGTTITFEVPRLQKPSV
jgi:two-component system sensor histidine kinase ChiS